MKHHMALVWHHMITPPQPTPAPPCQNLQQPQQTPGNLPAKPRDKTCMACNKGTCSDNSSHSFEGSPHLHRLLDQLEESSRSIKTLGRGLRKTTPLDTHVIGYGLYQDTEKDMLLNTDIAPIISHSSCHKPQSAMPLWAGASRLGSWLVVC